MTGYTLFRLARSVSAAAFGGSREPPALAHGEWLAATGLPKGTFGHCVNRLSDAKRVVRDGERYRVAGLAQ